MIELIKEICNLQPADFDKLRKSMVEQGIGEASPRELVRWIFEDLESELGETTISIKVKEKYTKLVTSI